MPVVVQDARTAHRPRVGMVPHDAAYLTHAIDREAVELVEVQAPVGAACITEAAADIDILHLHQGLAAVVPLGNPAELMAALERHRIPMVLTLHQPPPGGVCTDGAVLDVLVPAAGTVITLSPPSGGIVRTRWSVDPFVLPHPHVAALDRIATAQATPRAPGPWRIGLLPGGTPGGAVDLAQAVEALVPDHGVIVDLPDRDVRIGASTTVDWVAQLDMLVLPPGRWGSAGWVELCRDLRTGCVVPADPQEVVLGAVASYPGAGADPEVVTRAIARGLSALPVTPLDVEERRIRAALVRDEHVALYRALLAATTHLDEGTPHGGPDERPW